MCLTREEKQLSSVLIEHKIEQEQVGQDAQVDLSVIIPAYIEADSLALLLPRLRVNLAALSATSEILVVDTQDKLDQTEEVCHANGVTHIRRRGSSYGDAVHMGLNHARGRSILFMDADGSHNPSEIKTLWRHRSEYVLVIGSRYVAGGTTENPRILIAMSYVVNLVFRACFSLPCKDVSNSFRLYQAAALKSVPIQSTNFDLIPEVLIKLCSHYGTGSVLEVPITFEQRKKGQSKRNLLAFALTYLRTIIRLRQMLRQYQKEERSSAATSTRT